MAHPETNRFQSPTGFLRVFHGTYRKLGYYYGSGAAEAGSKTVTGTRLKQSGRFCPENALALH